MFVFSFSSCSRNLHSYEDVTITGERLSILIYTGHTLTHDPRACCWALDSGAITTCFSKSHACLANALPLSNRGGIGPKFKICLMVNHLHKHVRKIDLNGNKKKTKIVGVLFVYKTYIAYSWCRYIKEKKYPHVTTSSNITDVVKQGCLFINKVCSTIEYPVNKMHLFQCLDT